MATRDEYSDCSRDGAPMDRASAMREIDMSPVSLAEEAWYDSSMGRPTVGMRGSDINYDRPKSNRLGPNQPAG